MSVSLNSDFYPLSNSTFSPNDLQCFDTKIGRYILTAASFTYSLLVLPLSVFVLYVGFQQWRKQRSAPSTGVMTHSDFFTYNMAIIELILSTGYIFSYCSSYVDLPATSLAGIQTVSFIWPAQTLFPIVMCVERYLAVVHPITYRGLRQAGGVRIRNISTGCIWLGCFLWLGLLILLKIPYSYRRVTAVIILFSSLIVMMFCSLSVVYVLIRPRPGAEARNNVQVDQLKRRAICTVLISMVVLWIKFGGNVMVVLFRLSTLVSLKCVGEVSIFLFFLPSGVVLPLLFLYKAGKLPICKTSTGPG